MPLRHLFRLLSLPHVIQGGVNLTADEHNHAANIKPHHQDDHTREAAISGRVVAELAHEVGKSK